MKNYKTPIKIFSFICAISLLCWVHAYAEVEPLELPADEMYSINSIEAAQAFDTLSSDNPFTTYDYASGMDMYDQYADDYGALPELEEIPLYEGVDIDYMLPVVTDTNYELNQDQDTFAIIDGMNNPFISNPNVATDVAGAYVDQFGFVRPDTTQDALSAIADGQAGSLVDIAKVDADKEKILSLEDTYLSERQYNKYKQKNPEAKLNYTSWQKDQLRNPDIAEKFKAAGLISGYVGGGQGEVITNAFAFEEFPTKAEFYRGKLQAADQTPDYVGGAADILKTMTLYPEYGMAYSEKKIEEAVRPLTHYDSQTRFPDTGTSVRIAKGGKFEVYLTNAHVVADIDPKAPQPVYFVDGPDFRRLGKPEGLEDLNKFKEAIKKDGGTTIYGLEKRYGSGYDTAVFNLFNPQNEVRNGDSIEIFPISETNPVKDDVLLFYKRPSWKWENDPAYSSVKILDQPYIDQQTSWGNKWSGEALATDAKTTKSVSGTPLIWNRGGSMNIGGEHFWRDVDPKSDTAYSIMPSYIHTFIEESRKPSEGFDK